MIRLYIARHGETLWNTRGIMQGWSDSPLTEVGIEQARLLGERLKNVNFSTVYSSSCKRAFHTAEIVRGSRNIEVIPNDGLREISLGIWEGMPKGELERNYPEQSYNFWNRPDKYEPVSGESFYQVRERVTNELKGIVKKHDEENILVVTHAVALKSMMSEFEGRDVSKLWEPPYINQTSLSIVEIQGDKANIVLYGDDSHINKGKKERVTAV